MKMSLCHSWLGVLRSKNLGFATLRFLGSFGGTISPASCRVERTFSLPPGSPRNENSVSAIRRTPKEGFSRLSSTIARSTAPGSRLPGPGWRLGARAASPPVRHALRHPCRVTAETPHSAHATPGGIPSSSTSRTTRSLNVLS